MASSNHTSPLTTKTVLSLKDLGIDCKTVPPSCITMESEKYICIRETNSVVVIDMAKPMQPTRLPIAADSAPMNPQSPILAFKVKENEWLDNVVDQLQIFNVEAKTTLKSYSMTEEEVVYWKWITPKILGLITDSAVYHWFIEGPTEPVKIFDGTSYLEQYKIINYLCDPSEKWLAAIEAGFDTVFEVNLLVRPYQSEHEWFRIPGVSAAAFATFNAENGTPSTLLCYAQQLHYFEEDKHAIKLCVTDLAPVARNGELGFQKKETEFTVPCYDLPQAVQLSQKYGLIYVITQRGFMYILDLETTEAIFSHKISDNLLVHTIEGTSGGNFYAIDSEGQVLLTIVNDLNILSFVSDKKLLNGWKKHDIRKLCLQMRKEIDGLKKQNAEQQSEKDNVVAKLENSLKEEIRKKEETEGQLMRMRTELLNEIDELKKVNTTLRDKIVTDMTKSVPVEKCSRRELEEQVLIKIEEFNKFQQSQEEMLHEIERLRKQNADLTVEKDKTIRNLEEFRTWIEGWGRSSSDHLEANFTKFTHSQLKDLTNDFSDSLKIGEGGYGSVYKAFLGLKPVAIKILKHVCRFGNKEFNQEVEILSTIRHPNLVILLGACPEAHALVYELMPNGSLFDILRNKQQSNALTWKKRIFIASDICSALIVLHSAKPHGIVHADLKSANILLDSNYAGKLSDFGICRYLQQTDTRITPHHYTNYPKGTIPYMDPEYLETGEMTAQYDVYSFGIVLLELVTQRCPVVGFRKSVLAALRKGNFVDASAGEWPVEEAKKMVLSGLQCSDPSREKRPDLEKEVWVKIESMRRASLRF